MAIEIVFRMVVEQGKFLSKFWNLRWKPFNCLQFAKFLPPRRCACHVKQGSCSACRFRRLESRVSTTEVGTAYIGRPVG